MGQDLRRSLIPDVVPYSSVSSCRDARTEYDLGFTVDVQYCSTSSNQGLARGTNRAVQIRRFLVLSEQGDVVGSQKIVGGTSTSFSEKRERTFG